MLEMHNISKIFRADLIETHALRDFSLTVKGGEFVAVTGPSGSGKTTFLNVAGLLESFDTGKYLLDGSDVSDLSDDQRSRLRNEKIGFIFQSFNLIPDLNIYDNVDVPLRYRRMNAKERNDVLKFERGSSIDDATRSIFVLRGNRAVRVPVELGAASVAEIEVTRGLSAGDRVIVSDMRDFDGADEVAVTD